MRIVRGLTCGRHCVASTCSTSDVPTGIASAPSAPWVDVCESPHAIVMPGCERPSSGPITCTMPWRRLRMPYSGMPNSAQLRSSAATCLRERWSAIASRLVRSRGSVGTLWSAVASVRSGRRTLRPASRRPSKACAEVTSCTRCRST